VSGLLLTASQFTYDTTTNFALPTGTTILTNSTSSVYSKGG
jgi:hypothetical protein